MDWRTTRRPAAPGRVEEHPLGDAGQIAFITLFLAVWITDSFFLRRTTWISAFCPLWIRLPLALLVSGSGLALLRSHSGSYARLGVSLCYEGAYGRIRHPVYMSVVLIMLGIALSTLSIAAILSWIALFAFYDRIAAYEEKKLVAAFGDAYRAYMEKIPRWIPRFRVK
jgi:protein-S-isoprenylcysteine O-methyltransferase Ste14